MNELQNLLDRIDKKANALIENYHQIRADNETLKNKIYQLNKENESLKKEIDQLKEKNKLLKISGAIKSTDNKEVKLKINELVREIDKCILQLNKTVN